MTRGRCFAVRAITGAGLIVSPAAKQHGFVGRGIRLSNGAVSAGASCSLTRGSTPR